MLKIDEIRIRDPYILVDDKENVYYLYGTTDENVWEGKACGFNAYKSTNLIDFEGPFQVFSNIPDFWSDENYWAPEVYELDDSYYMVASFKSKDKCRATQILKSTHPLGMFIPISDNPITPATWECLDGTLYFDEYKTPWLVFSREWQQIGIGKIYATQLSHDLKKAISEPIVLFSAIDAKWTVADTGPVQSDGNAYVTDGPFLYETKAGELIMFWSSYGKYGYAIGIARSSDGTIDGKWIHDEEPFFEKDGGHGMLFRKFDNQLVLAIHTPNSAPDERLKLISVNEDEI